MTSAVQRFVNIKREEIGLVIAAALYFFFILTALQILRPTRDALGMQRGIDELRWAFVVTLIATAIVNPLFSALVSRFRRMVFISTVHVFFGVSLLGFCALLLLAPQAVGERTGQVFYVWMSVFNYFITMLFWAMIADRFALEQSKRLFGVISAGGTLGAITGSWLTSILAKIVGAPMLLVIAAAFLMIALVAAWTVASMQPEVARTATDKAALTSGDANEALIGGSAWEGFRAVFRSPYLLGIAAYVLIVAVMVTFVYFTRLKMVEALCTGDVDLCTSIFGNIDMKIQLTTLVLQLLVTGQLMKRLGVHITLALLPITVALGFIGLAIVGSLAALVLFEATFKAVQRAIMRPARETLFTVVSREEKYKAKAVIDTFGYRAGDALGAGSEGLLAKLGMALIGLASVAVPLALVWAALGIWLGRTQQRIAKSQN